MKILFLIASLLSTEVFSECPCDSFANDVLNLQVKSDRIDYSRVIERINECISCREKKGITYHFCDSRIMKNRLSIRELELASIKELQTEVDEDKLLYYNIDGYQKDCEQGIFYNVDSSSSGTKLIGTGIGLLAGCVTFCSITPAALKWSTKDDGATEIILFDVLVILGKLIVTVVVPIVDIALCIGGTTSLVIGIHQNKNYHSFQKEMVNFKNDLQYLPCIQLNF